jgi:DNA/RNA endonuclease YhcR with UshA esterase domain
MEQENKEQLNQIVESLKDISKSLNRDPQAEFYHSETHCPSCGRFVGTETRCPYCQTETQKRLSIRIFKVISVLLSTLGLIMLLFYARSVNTPSLDIKDIGPLSNFGHFSISGVAQDDCSINKNWGTVSFYLVQHYDKDGKRVNDPQMFKFCETKEIRVSAYKNIAENIYVENLPRKGEQVVVEGQVSVKQGVATLIINAPEHIKTFFDPNKPRKALDAPNQKKKANIISIDSPEKITAQHVNKLVKLTGTVKISQNLENDCSQILLENGTAEGFIVFIPQFSKKDIVLPNAGTKIEVVGPVKEYNGKLEVTINKKQDYKELQK